MEQHKNILFDDTSTDSDEKNDCLQNNITLNKKKQQKLKGKSNILKTKNKQQQKKKENTISNLDSKHKKQIETINEKKLKLPVLKSHLYNANCELEKINKKKKEELKYEDINKKISLQEKINELNEKIIESNNNEVDYFYNTLPILKEYYFNTNKNNNLLVKKKVNIIPNSNNLLSYIEVHENGNKADLYNKYLNVVDPKMQKIKIDEDYHICSMCETENVYNQTTGYYVCVKCGNSTLILMNNNKPNYKDSVIDTSSFTYKRINHLNEILSQIQGNESTIISKEIYTKILNEISKSKKISQNLELLTPKIMRNILRKLELNTCYEHIQYIINKINKVPPPKFSRASEDKIRSMFREIQEPYERCKPKLRKNFLNYSYVIHKCCELLELDDFLPYLPLLKSPEKLQLQDKIWKEICKELRWQFIPSSQKIKKN